ncbi:MAG: hypothetical protein GX383_11590 [Clostridium sp.]|jgi:hypothetical protein|nr:hypothetical protein [Clostridium sp.]
MLFHNKFTLEREVLENGIKVNNGKPWKVYDAGEIIRAKGGMDVTEFTTNVKFV